jgi:hypothetical protein
VSLPPPTSPATTPPDPHPAPVATTADGPSLPASGIPDDDRWELVARDCLIAGRAVLAAALGDRRVTVGPEELTVVLPLAPAELDRHRAWLEQRLRRECGDRRPVIAAAANPTATAGDQRRTRYRQAEEHPRVEWLRQNLGAEIVGREIVDRDSWLAHLRKERGQ